MMAWNTFGRAWLGCVERCKFLRSCVQAPRMCPAVGAGTEGAVADDVQRAQQQEPSEV